jgi:glycosyltransferase involved in cell wall biosynthesis
MVGVNSELNMSPTKNILLIGSYAPRKCGIATHLLQLEHTLRGDGAKVDILSSLDCDGTFRENLRGGINILKVLKYAKNYDIVNIHFEFSEFFYIGHNPLRLLNIFPLLALGILFYVAKNLNLVMHESPPTPFFFQRTFLQRLIWSRVPKITFFTEKEKHVFERKYNFKFLEGQSEIEDVTKYFQKHSNLSKIAARNKLKIDKNRIMFLCIGFIHENKGFDRIAAIISAGKYENCELYIVGSVRLESDTKAIDYVLKLRSLCDESNGVNLVERYLGDQDLDEWIIAADYVVVPYRLISNSGVLGRAKIFNRPAIVSNVGGLPEQVGGGDVLFSSDAELKEIVDNIVSRAQAQKPIDF